MLDMTTQTTTTTGTTTTITPWSNVETVKAFFKPATDLTTTQKDRVNVLTAAFNNLVSAILVNTPDTDDRVAALRTLLTAKQQVIQSITHEKLTTDNNVQ